MVEIPKVTPTKTDNDIILQSFNAVDVCKIIQTCYKCKVSTLKLGDLSLEFSASQANLQQVPLDRFNQTPEQGEVENNPDPSGYSPEQLELLHLEDPVAYEQLVTQGKITYGSSAED